jgi:hypothetical protein
MRLELMHGGKGIGRRREEVVGEEEIHDTTTTIDEHDHTFLHIPRTNSNTDSHKHIEYQPTMAPSSRLCHHFSPHTYHNHPQQVITGRHK